MTKPQISISINVAASVVVHASNIFSSCRLYVFNTRQASMAKSQSSSKVCKHYKKRIFRIHRLHNTGQRFARFYARPPNTDIEAFMAIASQTNVESIPKNLAELHATTHEIKGPRRLSIGIVGEPNAGKSSLLNLIVNSPVSAVSPKRNTTRESIVGVHMTGNTQLIFHDTPGFMKHKIHKEYYQPLQNSVDQMCQSVDAILLVVDAAKRIDLQTFNVIADLGQVCRQIPMPPHVILILNKVDLVDPKDRLLQLSEMLHAEADKHLPQKWMWPTCFTDCRGIHRSMVGPPETLIKQAPSLNLHSMLSKSDLDFVDVEREVDSTGITDVIEQLLYLAKPGDWDFDIDDVTDLAPEDRAVETVKEAIFHLCHKELPYMISISTIEFLFPGEGSSPSDRHKFVIRHRLDVRSKSHARILNKSLLQAIKNRAIQGLKKILDGPVNLDFSVRVTSKKIK